MSAAGTASDTSAESERFMKKVLGISFGRKMMNCDVMVKHALMECEKAGYEVRFIRADDLNIHNCTGCIACTVGMMTGRGRGECVHKDDFPILDEAFLEADAVIYGCPTYEMTPTGRFKTICDRMGPSHDISFRKTAIEEGLAAGKPPEQLPDLRSLKPRVAAFFSVGGAMTKNWLAFMLPTMYALSMSTGMDVVDTFEYHGAMAFNHVIGNERIMARTTALAQHVIEALACEDEAGRKMWRGDHEGVCPVCHCDMLTVSDDRLSVECPVCGIRGAFEAADGRLEISFSEQEQARSRLTYAGKLEHSTEIKTRAVGPGQIPDLNEKLKPYRWE